MKTTSPPSKTIAYASDGTTPITAGPKDRRAAEQIKEGDTVRCLLHGYRGVGQVSCVDEDGGVMVYLPGIGMVVFPASAFERVENQSG